MGMVLAGGVALSIHTEDPHFINRAGATMAALSVFLGFLEYNIDREIHSAERYSGGRTLGLAPSEAGLVARKIRHWMQKKRADHRTVVAASCVFAAIGEALHGWGDLTYEWLRCIT
jgi:hypothetical protein